MPGLFDLQMLPKIGHMLHYLVKRNASCQASSPNPRVDGTEHETVRLIDRMAQGAYSTNNERIEFVLVHDNHLADGAESAGLPQNDHAKGVDVNLLAVVSEDASSIDIPGRP